MRFVVYILPKVKLQQMWLVRTTTMIQMKKEEFCVGSVIQELVN